MRRALVATTPHERLKKSQLRPSSQRQPLDDGVPDELREMLGVLLLPHIGSASEQTRAAMGALVLNDLIVWFDTGEAITPVPETAGRRD